MTEAQNKGWINNLKELSEEVCAADDTASSIAKRLYKDTNCGIGFHSDPKYVLVSGYCEGIDQECESYQIEYPFRADEFWEFVKQADKDGCELWDKTHGCEDCWGGESICNEWGDIVGPQDYGMRPIDTGCTGCSGEGMII